MKIATWNIKGVRSGIGNLVDWLTREQPDIVCLQELKTVDAGCPVAAIEAAGYGALWRGQKSWNGVAILSRGSMPLLSRDRLPGDAKDLQRRYLEAAVQGVMVACLYLPNGNPRPGPKFDYKLAWFERLIGHAAALHSCGHPVVLAGDFNVGTDRCGHIQPRIMAARCLAAAGKPSSVCTAAQARLVRRIARASSRCTDVHVLGYFRQHWQRDAGLRIDHLLLNPPLAPRLKAAGVDRWAQEGNEAGGQGKSDGSPMPSQ